MSNTNPRAKNQGLEQRPETGRKPTVSRLYSLFDVTQDEQGRKTYTRSLRPDGTHYSAFTATQAARLFQDILLAPYLNGIGPIRELRPVASVWPPRRIKIAARRY